MVILKTIKGYLFITGIICNPFLKAAIIVVPCRRKVAQHILLLYGVPLIISISSGVHELPRREWTRTPTSLWVISPKAPK
jgi:hypothetical protein